MDSTTFKDSNPDAQNNLKQEEAVKRSKQVKNVSYNINLKLTGGAPQYQSHVTIEFEKLSEDSGQPVFLDFVGHEITELTVNGKTATENPFTGHRVILGNSVQVGPNVVSIKYTNNYDHSGDGFHQFIDPEDKQEYLYTNFEPFEAHRLFPCFDQPDIKGIYTLTVEAPSDWKVIANAPKETSTASGDSKTTHKFQTTKKFSTYLFAFVAGPYEEVHELYDGRIPLGIFCRKSLTKFLDKDNIFTETKQGMKFYEDFFGVQYPFLKYDQIFVPEFNVGAMENVGCVTFNEGYVFKDPPTLTQRANRSDTILHEMAHMWFGNLVSPVWWDGLWLNESFATYMAALCVSEATQYTILGWQNFSSGMKEWAYREDQLSTTHPIQGVVVDTTATFLTFDGITYGKGASLLKQLVYLLGKENFKKGMQYYFQKHAWGNTTIHQFLEALEIASSGSGDNSFKAVDWSREWLETSGLNALNLKLTTDSNGVVQSAVVVQTATPENPVLRNHFMEIVTYELVDGTPKTGQIWRQHVLPQAETNVERLVGKPRPQFVWLNNNDNSFAKCLLDEPSQRFAVEHLEKFDDSLLRQLLWSSFYQQTRDAQMKSTTYLELVHSKCGFIKEPKLLQTVLQRAQAALTSFVPERLQPEQSDLLFNSTFSKINGAADDFKILWARFSVHFARTQKTVETLVKLVKEGNTSFDQGMRWSIIVKALAWKIEGAEALLTAEQEKDKSDTGDRAVLTAKTSVPDAQVKVAAWERYLDKDTKLSSHQIAADMSGFQWPHQKHLTQGFSDKFFQNVRTVFKSRDKETASSYFYHLFPEDPENLEILAKAKELLGQLDPEEKHLRKELKGKIDDIERSLKCFKLFQ